VGAHGSRLGGGDHRKVNVLGEVTRRGVVAVDPHRAQRAGLRLGLAVHEVVQDQRPVRGAEQLGKPYVVAACNIDQLVVVHNRVGRQLSPQRCHALDVIHQLQLGASQFLALTPILVGFLEPGEVHVGAPRRESSIDGALSREC